jgi:hypothetical protein
MAWSTDFEELMPHTVTVASLSGLSTDGYGTETFGTATSYSARVIGKQHVVKSLTGIDETARTLVYIASTSTFPASAQYTLPDASTPEVLAVEAVPDEDGVHHIKVSFA